ncbi:biotin/lipoyl-binding carrier protein [Paralcaligenes sp. KSB-10]|uniref:biotin/lipoyl-binding carrier protein n=1 Tax=Paralcaligenes sp. KSB-10 TaxID=2901142 RepID=UPI001E61B889|nr:biotin/lipoyl-binding carrier protein [Paralcaligenes sp. KSB-10]UHL64223.1 biotin/lipoyl-binding carrier protein [Paralcaligenes sp. KSB-10]
MVQEINSEITGSMWKVLCKVNQRVAKGDEIFIVESMKMEIPVLAEEDGLIVEILVNEGQTITEGQLMARVEPNK